MKELLIQLSTLLRDISNELFDTNFRKQDFIPNIYEVQINDHDKRSAQTVRFESIREAMDWAYSRNLLYEPTKSVYLIRVKPTGVNDILRLNLCKNVSTKGPSVLRSKTKDKAVLN